MSNFTLRPDVYYRLENVDYGAFLELRTLNSKAELVLRPQKDGMQQQWTFVKISDGQYKIQNALPGNKRLFLTTSDDSVSASSAGHAKTWSIRLAKNFFGQFLFVSSKSDGDDQFLYIDDGQKVKVLDENFVSDVADVNLRWRIKEVMPSVPKDVMLPKDTYRIRNLNGVALQMSAGTDIVTAKQASGDYQAWEIVPIGNGKCTIQNSGEKTAYLGWHADSKTGFAAVRKVSSPHTWELTSFGGGYTYSVGMNWQIDQVSIKLALSLGDTHELALKPSKFAHNQIWLFEPTDGKNSGLPTVDGGDGLPPYDSISEKRYANISQKSYTIRNQGSGLNWMCITSGPWRVYPYTSQSNSNIPLVYHDSTSARFTLNWMSTVWFTISAGTVILDSYDHATSWVLQASASNPSLYYICVAGEMNKVISGNTTNDVNGYGRFVIETKVEGNSTQLWSFA